jgi:DNA-binding IclR family transcriptional regulator
MTMVLDVATEPEAVTRTAAARVLSVLGAFSRGGGALTLTEISRYADLPLTTAHRLAREVLAWGGIEQDETGRYRLSSKILDLASSSTHAMRVRESALPHLFDLHRLSCLTVHLGVRDGNDVMYLEALRPHSNYSGENRMGGHMQLHVTATGIVLLAYETPEFVDEYLSRPLKRYTPHTLADPDAIRTALEKVRKNRVAVISRSISLGAGAVAAPVFNPDGSVETVVGTVFLTPRDDPQKLIDPVRMTAGRIAHALADRSAAPDPRTVDFNRRNAGLL